MPQETKITDFIDPDLYLANMCGEIRQCTSKRILFSNGWGASIIRREDSPELFKKESNNIHYSVACMDINGYISYDHPERNSTYALETEEEVCELLRRIRRLPSCLDD